MFMAVATLIAVKCLSATYPVLASVSRSYPGHMGRLPTCYSPVRHQIQESKLSFLSFDLHVLGMPPAFILSQDQTLHCKNIVQLRIKRMIVCSVQDANILSSSLKYLSLYLLTVASFYPSGFPIAPEAARFLYYYSSVYLKSFKELFLQRSGEVFHSRKRMQRYSFFQHKPNISTKKLKIFFTY